MGEEADGGCTKSTTTEAAETGLMRIYVGGLGGTVTADDLRKTFSAPHLGTVTAVEVIRTKGRSFAYLEFLPSSDKGLAKLFSSYNGCMWKGGRLRLEKAKEHYLLRLKREWEEETELASDSCSHIVDAVESVDSHDKPKKLPNLEKMQLRLFFPELGKVKLVPFKGTGKHKYSFQRVQAPPLPIHFCDCEEHSGALQVAKQQKYSNLLNPTKEESFYDHGMENGGVNEEELNLMNSVMNKLFEKENFSKVTNSRAGFSMQTDKVVNSIDSRVAEDEEDQVSDDDNLIINLVGGPNYNLSLFENLPATDNQDSVAKESRNSKDRPAQEMYGSQKRTHIHTTEKSKRNNRRKDDDAGIVSDIPEKKRRNILPSDNKKKAPLHEGEGNGTVSDIPEIEGGSDIHINYFGTSPELQQTNSESKTSQLSGKSAWSQKSAWKNLVRGADNTTFQISDIAPSVSHDIEVEPGSDRNVSHDIEVQPGSDRSVSHDIEVQPESDSLSEPCFTDKENLKNDLLQTTEPKVSGAASSSNTNVLADKATKGASWLQKSSWTKMVGDSNRGSFSISQILPDVTFENNDLQQHISIDFSSSKNKKRQNHTGQVSESQGGSHTDVFAADDNSTLNALADREGNHDSDQSNAETTLQMDRKNNEASTSSFGKKQPTVPKPGDTDTDETFTFMRSAASMKEWMKTKASISGSLKKKGNLK